REGDQFIAVAAGYGVNRDERGNREAVFAEITKQYGLNSLYGRGEAVQVETALLARSGSIAEGRRDVVGAFTVGGVRDILRRRGFEGGFGAAATFYGVPDALKPTHGDHPVSFQLFFRL